MSLQLRSLKKGKKLFFVKNGDISVPMHYIYPFLDKVTFRALLGDMIMLPLSRPHQIFGYLADLVTCICIGGSPLTAVVQAGRLNSGVGVGPFK